MAKKSGGTTPPKKGAKVPAPTTGKGKGKGGKNGVAVPPTIPLPRV